MRFCGCWVPTKKKLVVFKDLVDEANKEVQPFNEETGAVKVEIEVFRVDARTRHLCFQHLFIPELSILYILLLLCMSIKSSVHNVSNCCAIQSSLVIQVQNK